MAGEDVRKHENRDGGGGGGRYSLERTVGRNEGFQDERTPAGWRHEGLVKEKQIQRDCRNDAVRLQRRKRPLFLL